MIYKSTREAVIDGIKGVIQAVFNKHIIKLFLEIWVYGILVVYILYKIEYWEFIHTKDTVLWILFTAFWLSFQTINNRYKDNYLTILLKSTFEVTIVIEFLVNTYTFSIITEIILIAFLSVINLITAYTSNTTDDYENDVVYRLLNNTNIFIGLIIGFFTLRKLLSNSADILTINTLKDFLLPIILTVMYIPFLYFLLFQILYEELFVLTKLNRKASKKIIILFKIKTYFTCRFNKEKIYYLKEEKRHLIRNMETKEDVAAIFNS